MDQHEIKANSTSNTGSSGVQSLLLKDTGGDDWAVLVTPQYLEWHFEKETYRTNRNDAAKIGNGFCGIFIYHKTVVLTAIGTRNRTYKIQLWLDTFRTFEITEEEYEVFRDWNPPMSYLGRTYFESRRLVFFGGVYLVLYLVTSYWVALIAAGVMLVQAIWYNYLFSGFFPIFSFLVDLGLIVSLPKLHNVPTPYKVAIFFIACIDLFFASVYLGSRKGVGIERERRQEGEG
ncbi:MAG: hypothetical protein ACRDHZ_03825 [Ktedonobacteraceae bacterium]